MIKALAEAPLHALRAHERLVGEFGEKGAMFEEELLDATQPRRWGFTHPARADGDGAAAGADGADGVETFHDSSRGES